MLNIFPVVKHVNPKASDAFHFFQSGQAKVQQGACQVQPRGRVAGGGGAPFPLAGPDLPPPGCPAGFLKEGCELINEALNLFNNVYGAMHVEICACLRLLARLHYIMGDYAEVGHAYPLGLQQGPRAWSGTSGAEGGMGELGLHSHHHGSRKQESRQVGLEPLSPQGPGMPLTSGPPQEEQVETQGGACSACTAACLRCPPQLPPLKSCILGRAAMPVDKVGVMAGPPFTGMREG